jgi:hypothetical protein
MVEWVRRAIEVPEISRQAVWTTVSAGSFLVLLAQDAVHPLIVFALEIFLSF